MIAQRIMHSVSAIYCGKQLPQSDYGKQLPQYIAESLLLIIAGKTSFASLFVASFMLAARKYY
jgi:hypothetical protein